MPGPWEKYNNQSEEKPWLKYSQEPTEPKDITEDIRDAMPKSVQEFGGNVLTSGGKFIGDVATAITSPVQTAKGIVALGVGTVQKLTEPMQKRLYQEIGIPYEPQYAPVFDAFINSYVEKYGGWDKFKNTLYTDPVAVLADVSTAAAGAGIAIKGLGTAGKISGMTKAGGMLTKTGKNLTAFSEITDPFQATMKTTTALGRRLTPSFVNPNIKAAEAAQWALNEGIPISAGAATGVPTIKGIEYLADRSIGGGLISQASKQEAANALKTAGQGLSSRVFPTTIVPEQAGTAIQQKVSANISGLAKRAKAAYSDLDRIENLPSNKFSVQVGTEKVDTGVLDQSGKSIINDVPIMKDISLPVDISDVKQALKPIYDEWIKTMPEARKQASPGLVAMKNILDSDDVISAATAERNLGALKKNAGYGMKEGTRNLSQGISANLVKRLQERIDDAVIKAGPDAIEALRKGRALTAQKWGAIDIAKALKKEPVKAFTQATLANDAGIEFLRKLEKQAPGEMRKIGSAYLDNLIDMATQGGGFNRTDMLYAQWNKLGDSTKKILFPTEELRKNLDNFFQTAKMMGENINPSGTGQVAAMGAQGALLLTHPISQVPLQIGAAGLSKMLHNPKMVNLLINGMKTPLENKVAAVSIYDKLKGYALKSVTPSTRIGGPLPDISGEQQQ